MSSEKQSVLEKLSSLGACEEAIAWASKCARDTAQELWDGCQMPEWLLWLIGTADSSDPVTEARKPLVSLAMDVVSLRRILWERHEHLVRSFEKVEAWVAGQVGIREASEAALSIRPNTRNMIADTAIVAVSLGLNLISRKEDIPIGAAAPASSLTTVIWHSYAKLESMKQVGLFRAEACELIRGRIPKCPAVL